MKKRDEEHIKKIVKPIFDRVPQETTSNHRMVGSSPKTPHTTFLWQPHNYRLYFDFNKINFNPKKPPNHTLQKYKSMVPTFNTAYTYTPLNYDSEHSYERFMFCTIRVKKNQIEIINNYHQKQWRRIKAVSINDVSKRIDIVINELREQSIEALKTFMDLHGGSSELKILKERCEHGIHGDDYLDKIPREYIIEDTYFKKPYLKKVEFKTIPAIKNYITNRAIESIAPDITNSINNIGNSISSSIDEFKDIIINDLRPTIKDLNLNMKTHTSVLKGIDKSFKKFNAKLSQTRLNQFF